MLFYVFIEQSVWRSQPIEQQVFQKGHGEAISVVGQALSVKKKELNSPAQKIFPETLLQVISGGGIQIGSR